MKINFSLGIYCACPLVSHLIKEQSFVGKFFDSELECQEAWDAKEFPGMLTIIENHATIQTWSTVNTFPFPILLNEIRNLLYYFEKKNYYVFECYGLQDDTLSGPSHKTITLRKKESILLGYLMEHSKATKDELLENVWNYDKTLETRTVESHMHQLRQKIHEGFSSHLDIGCTNSIYNLYVSD